MITFRSGQVWRTRGGKTCKIVLAQNPATDNYPICSNLYHRHWHNPDGTSCLGGGTKNEDDLIELLSDLD